MSKCKSIRKQFVDALYDELETEEKNQFHTHLVECDACTRAYADLASTLGIMDHRSRPEPDDVFWTGYWDRLAPQLEPASEHRGAWWKNLIPEISTVPRWAFQATAAAAILVVGIFIGKNTIAPTDPRSYRLTEAAASSPEFVSLQNRVGRYLDRSKVLLLGIVNFDAETEDPSTLNLSRKREISQGLVHEAGLLRDELSDYSTQDQLIGLIADLEVILMQIANLEEEHDLDAVDIVRSGVDRKGVLLKITLEEMRRPVQPDTPPINDTKTNSTV